MPTPRDERLYIRVKPDERKQMAAAAKRADLSLSAWLRMVALAAAEAQAGKGKGK